MVNEEGKIDYFNIVVVDYEGKFQDIFLLSNGFVGSAKILLSNGKENIVEDTFKTTLLSKVVFIP